MIGFSNRERPRIITAYARRITPFLLLSFPSLGDATPLRRNLGQSTTSNSTQIWVPIVAVVLVVLAMVSVFWWRKALRTTFLNIGEAAAVAAGAGASVSTQMSREVTAEQLAGRTSTGVTTAPGGAVTAGRTRRARPRRTPSQISTHSLPLYNKEPGDQELVIYRGEDPEDHPDIPITVIMPPVEEGAEGGHSREGSQTSIYGQLPESPQNQSLMQGDESLDGENNTSTRLLLPAVTTHRTSVDTIAASEEGGLSLPQAVQQAAEVDPRGEAPAYFEAVDLNDTIGPRQEMPNSTTARPAAETPQPATVGSRPSTDTQASQETRASRRMSGFRGLLNTFTTNTSARPPIPPIPQESSRSPTPGHTRGLSSLSAISSNDAHGRTSRASHAPSHSGSGSMMAVFRTISRQKSHNTLNSNHFNSPSMISLNSISAPLSHTLTRTEISYPAAGPTAEQMRLISSRESFARFAVPYGADAIAYAASTSMQDLEPTPDYSESHPSLLPAPGPSTVFVVRSPLAGAPVRRQQRPSTADSSDSQSLEEAPPDDVEETNNIVEPTEVAPQPVHHNEEPSSSATAVDTDFSPSAETPKPSAKFNSVTSTTSLPPPSSFKLPIPMYTRPESRASSMMSTASFATADEMYESALSGADTPDEVPSTPLATTFNIHARDATDMTITQN